MRSSVLFASYKIKYYGMIEKMVELWAYNPKQFQGFE